MKKVVFVLTMILVSSTVSFADDVVKKSLGDINGDGIKEVVVEEWSTGSSGESAMIKIFSGKRLVFGPVGLSGDTADGYKIIGKEIVVWQGDWNTGSKWDPHFYNLTWYSWSKKTKKFEICREGFTVNAYSYKQAQKVIPILATKPGKTLVLSQSSTFARDAGLLVLCQYSKYGKKLDRIEENNGSWNHWTPNDSRWFWVSLRRNPPLPTINRTDNPNSILIEVIFHRHGKPTTHSYGL